MSRRKVRALTRTGRQVSEDPDIDNLLSNLSPEEMEELQKEVLTLPDPDPDPYVQGGIRKRTSLEKQPSVSNNVEHSGRETSKRSQRQLSIEEEPKRESLKQQYLRKMGLSQDWSQGVEVTRQSNVSGEHDHVRDEKLSTGHQPRPSNRFSVEESRDMERKEAGKEINDESKLIERKEDSKKKEDCNSKTKELISKLQEKKEDVKEKERKDESRKDGKTKELISKLQERSEKVDAKEREKKEETWKKEDSKTKGLISRLEEKKSQVKENKTEERKSRGDEKTQPAKQLYQTGSQHEEKDEAKAENEKENVKEREWKNFTGKGDEKENVKEKVMETQKLKASTEGLKPSKNEEPVVGKSQSTQTKENNEEEDEDASMFDELLEKVISNDPQLTELNINNSEAIKTKTLIQFAEALRDNSHVKLFALANTRADDHVAYAVAAMLHINKTVSSINLDSNHLTSKGIIALIHALQRNTTLTELRFHNQRHICGGKTEMEMAKVLKENTTLLRLGYHFELAGPRMTMTNILSRNMDRQRQRRLQEQKQAQANGEKKGTLEVPKASRGLKPSPKASPKISPLHSPQPSPQPSPKVTPKKGGGAGAGAGVGVAPPPPPPPSPPGPALDMNCLRNSLTPVSQRKLGDKGSERAGGKNSRDQLLASIRNSNIKQLKKVEVPKLLQ